MTENYGTTKDAAQAWSRLGDALNDATALYLKEVSAYLTWARDLQRDALAQTFFVSQQLAKLTEEQLAFYQRVRAISPPIGAVPKGTETITGMVDAVVRETGRPVE